MKWTVDQYSHRSMLNVACFLILSLRAAPLFSQELQWKVLGHMQQPRTDFGIATIGKGKVLVIGGFTEWQGVKKERHRGDVTATCEVIDVESRLIFQTQSLNVPHAETVALGTVDSNVIVISGLNTDSTTTPICEMFDRKKNGWRVLGSLLIGRHYHMAAFINQEEIMVVGGRANYNYAGTIAEAEIFNIRTGKSRMVSDFPSKGNEGLAFKSELFSSQHIVFFSGRSEGYGYRPSNGYYYDTLSQHWKYAGRLPDGTYGSASKLLFDGRLVITGGIKQESKIQPILNSDVRLEDSIGFVVVGVMIQPRHAFHLEQWSKEVIISMGGLSVPGSTLSNTEWFDLRTKQSFEGPPMNDARSHLNSVSFPTFDSQGNQQKACIVIFGGRSVGNRSLSSVEILETTNPQLIELPSTEIASRRRQQLLTSPAVIITLTVFILVLILALLYLLVQVLIIKQKATLPVWENEPLEVKQ